MTEAKPNSLATKLATIGAEIGKISKTGYNEAQKFNFIEYGEVGARIRETFAKYKVAFIPAVEDYDMDTIESEKPNYVWTGGVKRQDGTKTVTAYHFIVRMKMTFIDGETGETIERPWTGEAIDYGDKGINKAETSGVKYFLMRTFNISEKGEDPDEESAGDIKKTSRGRASGVGLTPEQRAWLKEAYIKIDGLTELAATEKAKHVRTIETFKDEAERLKPLIDEVNAEYA